MHSRQWWLRRCSSLTGSSKCENSRRMLLPTDNRAMSWEFDSTSNSRAWSPWWRDRTNLQNKTSSAIVQTDSRATRYGPNSVTSICCGFDVQLAMEQTHNNPQRIHNRSTANRMPTTNRQHLKPYSISRTSCKLHRESKKTRHLTLAHNFTKYWPIFKILSLLDSVGNF